MDEEQKKQQPVEDQRTDQQTDQPAEEQKPEKTFTRDQIGSIVEKQVSTKLDEVNSAWQAKLDEAVQKAKQDGKDEATLSAKELAEKQEKERAEELKRKQDDLAKRTQELDRREHIAHTRDLLAEQNLPTDSAEMLLGATEEDTKTNIENFKKLVDQGVRNTIHRKSAGKDPQVGSKAHVETPHKDLADMTYEEMQKYIESQQD